MNWKCFVMKYFQRVFFCFSLFLSLSPSESLPVCIEWYYHLSIVKQWKGFYSNKPISFVVYVFLRSISLLHFVWFHNENGYDSIQFWNVKPSHWSCIQFEIYAINRPHCDYTPVRKRALYFFLFFLDCVLFNISFPHPKVEANICSV